ncbi:MAG: hypothetical protein GY950_07460 [bacterium]|nr:hypothetical protein [bacterium]
MKTYIVVILLIFIFSSLPVEAQEARETREIAVIPGTVNQICNHTDFFYNYPAEDFFYYLNQRLLFMDKPDGRVTGKSIRNRVLKILRWHGVLKKSLRRFRGGGPGREDIITLNVGEPEGFKNASIILGFLGFQLEKTTGERFHVTTNLSAAQGLADYAAFQGLKARTIETQLNKTRRFHLKLTESEIPIPWDYTFLREITGLKIDSTNFFKTLCENERFSLFVGVLYRLSHRETVHIGGLVKKPLYGAWKKIYRDKKFLMGMFTLSHALRVDGGQWRLPGGPAAGSFWIGLTGKNYKAAPLAFLHQLAVKDEGKLNYFFLFSYFLPEATQEILFTGPNTGDIQELYRRIRLAEGEKLNESQFPGLGSSNLYTLLYALQPNAGGFYFPLGIRVWVRTVFDKGSPLDIYLLRLSQTDLGKPGKPLRPADDTIIILPDGKKVKGTIQSREGSKLVVVADIGEKKEAAAEENVEEKVEEKVKENVEETIEETVEEPVKKEDEPEEEELDKDYPEYRSLAGRVLGKFWPKRRFYFKINPMYFQPRDRKYRELYGDRFFFPELELGMWLTDKVTTWYRRGSFSGETRIPLLEQTATSSQSFVAFGLGYNLEISKTFALNMDVGLVRFYYEEEAMDERITGSASGLRFDGGITVSLNKMFFTDISISYMRAVGSVPDNPLVELGGLSGGIGFGLRF